MGRPPRVDHLRDSFLASADSARNLVDSVLAVAAINPATRGPRLHTEQSRRVVELAFLGLVSAWEEFTEQVFVRYLAGASTATGYSPQLRIGSAASIAHAYQVISGDPDYDPTKHYARFSDPRWVGKTAKLYFEQGAPFSARLAAKQDVLLGSTKLRNRVAHSSTKVRADFKAVALRLLGRPPNGRLVQGYRVGDLLLAPATHVFPRADRKANYFKSYDHVFRSLAQAIVP